MRSTFKVGLSALLFTLAIGIAGPARACEPNSEAFGAYCFCEPSGFELSGNCYDIGDERLRRGMMNLAQPYGPSSRLEFITWKVTSPTGEFSDQYLTLARSDSACVQVTPANTGNGCKAVFNVGQPPDPNTLMSIEHLDAKLRDVPGRRQNVFFSVSCDTLALGSDLTGKRFQAVAIVGFSDDGAPGTCRVDSNVKVQERPGQGDIIQEREPCA